MKTLNFNEMENVNGGNGTEDWCDGIDMMRNAGIDYSEINSSGLVDALYSLYCIPQE